MALARWKGLPLLNTSQSFHAVIHGESDDTVASSMNSEATEKFYREDSACAAHRAQFSEISVKYSTLFYGNSNRLCTTDVSLRIRRPFSSNTSYDADGDLLCNWTLREHQSLRNRPQANSSHDAGTPFRPVVSVIFAPSPSLLSLKRPCAAPDRTSCNFA